MTPVRRLGVDEVAALLPHAHPMRFVDTAEVVPGDRATAWWGVPMKAFWTDAHFPGAPVLPGALLLEAMAQAATLVAVTLRPGLPALVGVDRLRLRAPVRPGDALVLAAVCTRQGRLWSFDTTAHRGDTMVGEASLLATAYDGVGA